MVLKDGRRIHRKVEWPKDKPSFGKKEVEIKFRDLASLIFPDDRVEKLIQSVERLEDVNDISELADLLH